MHSKLERQFYAISLFSILFLGSFTFAIPPQSSFAEQATLGDIPGSILEEQIQNIVEAVPPDVGKHDKAQLPFIENQGQIDEKVKFYANTFAGTVFVTSDVLTYSLSVENSEDKSFSGLAIKELFVNSNPLQPTGVEKSQSVVNYFVGDKENWRSNVSTYDTISLGEVWPSIDVELNAYGNNVEKIFRVAPGGNVENIKLAFNGISGLTISDAGELLLETEYGTVATTAPLAYQNIDGEKRIVKVSYLVEDYGYGFVVGNYDPQHTLIIDPLIASTFLGGSQAGDVIFSFEQDGGDIYVVGSVAPASPFPTTAGAFDTSFNGVRDGFIAKYSNDLTTQLISTFIGGDALDQAIGIAIDSNFVYVIGYTESTDFPTTPGAFDTTRQGFSDVFVVKLNKNLSGPLVASTLLGGSQDIGNSGPIGRNIIIGPGGDLFLGGSAKSNDFPTTPGAFRTTMVDGFRVAFVTHMKNDLTGPLIASTFVKPTVNSNDEQTDLILDSSGRPILVGYTQSTNFPTTPGAYDTVCGGVGNTKVFITKLNSALTGLVASTCLGGTGDNRNANIAIDASDNVYVTGTTRSSDFPTIPGGFDTTFNAGVEDAFVSKLNPTLTTLLDSTFLGGIANVKLPKNKIEKSEIA